MHPFSVNDTTQVADCQVRLLHKATLRCQNCGKNAIKHAAQTHTVRQQTANGENAKHVAFVCTCTIAGTNEKQKPD